MSLTYGVKQVMHRIRVKLYPNYLQRGGAWLTRTDSEAVLTVKQICAAMRDRGGFTGNIHDLEKHINQYHDEVAYQLCDGYTVSNRYYSVYPNLGGTLNTPHDIPTHDKNPLSFRFRANKAMRDLAGSIEILVDGIAETDGYIDEFILHEGLMNKSHTNSHWLAGHAFSIHGGKIKIEGSDPDCGVYFISTEDPSKEEKVITYIENNPSNVRGIVPNISNFNKCRIVVRTQHSGSANLLRKPRNIISTFVLEEG